MKNRRLAVVSVAIAASLAFTTVACDRAGDEAGNEPSPTPASPRDALVASVAPLKTTPFKSSAKLADGITANAAVDPVAKAGTQTIFAAVPGTSASMNAELMIIGADRFVKIALRNLPNAPKLPSGWMKLDPSKLDKPDEYTLDDPDPASLERELFKGLTTVERAGDRKFTGTVDLTKATESGIVDDDTVKELGAKASSVPFEATLDEKGRIASFRIMVPEHGKKAAETWEIIYSDWEIPVQPQAPANAVPAPATVYEIFND
ncbi:MAG TPA: hypothetical protein VFM54_12365 [Micromonosporaceae bacterium]|nr:hypothetical protein [Micromonosporaceae bacterium]